jgi:hypothetical protein
MGQWAPTVADVDADPIWLPAGVALDALRDASVLTSCFAAGATGGKANGSCDPGPTAPAEGGSDSSGDTRSAWLIRAALLVGWHSSWMWLDFSGLDTVTAELARLRSVAGGGGKLLGAGDVLTAQARGAVGEGTAARDILSALVGEHLAASRDTITCALAL